MAFCVLCVALLPFLNGNPFLFGSFSQGSSSFSFPAFPLLFALLRKLLPQKLAVIGLLISAVMGELVMAAGYIAYEWFLYGFGKAILNLVPYLIKGGISVVLACLLYPVLRKLLGAR